MTAQTPVDWSTFPDVATWLLSCRFKWEAGFDPDMAIDGSIQRESYIQAWNDLRFEGENEDSAREQVEFGFQQLVARGLGRFRVLGYFRLTEAGRSLAGAAWAHFSATRFAQQPRQSEPEPVQDDNELARFFRSIDVSQAQVAEMWGVTRQAVYAWRKKDHPERPRFTKGPDKSVNTTLFEVLCWLPEEKYAAVCKMIERDKPSVSLEVKRRLDESRDLPRRLQVLREYREDFRRRRI